MQFTLISALAFATFAAATVAPVRRNNALPASQCKPGGLQCCNSAQTATGSSSTPVLTLLALLGIPMSRATGLIGVTCSPISAIGISGNSCSAQTVCCTDNGFHGLVALGCRNPLCFD